MIASRVTRRTFMQTALGAAVLPWLRPVAATSAAPGQFDPAFGTATAALAALEARVTSSLELTRTVFARIRQHNSKINAFVTLLEESALSQARASDRRRASGQALGVLDGLPVMVSASYEMAGIRVNDSVPTMDATAVARLKRAGAVIIGKTKTAREGEVETFNAIAGTTNNPWDVTRTAGGPSGGGAVALASGFGFLAIGSDIGGSLRVPSHFCGIYGHKSTLDVVPRNGLITGSPRPLAATEVLEVAGPLARSAPDLLLALGVLAGPTDDGAVDSRWQLPPSRANNLRRFRIGFVHEDAYCPLDADVAAVVADALDRMRAVGVPMKEGWPAGFDPQAAYDTYPSLHDSGPSPERNEQRLRAQAVWRDYFKELDAFVSPVCFTAAFPRDQNPAAVSRRSPDLFKWTAPATLLGCPATVIPIGRTPSGLPVGLQIMGPHLEDATPLTIAMCMEQLTGGFMAPPSFA